MIKNFLINKRIKEKLIQRYPRAMDKVNIEVILSVLLSQLPQSRQELTKQQFNRYISIVADTTIFYLRKIQYLLQSKEENAAVLTKDGNGSNDRKDGAAPA